jgi:hypothetical protein
LTWINDVNCLVAALEAILNEGKQYAVLFFVAVEECTDMTCFDELGAGKPNRGNDLLHRVYLLARVGFRVKEL